MDVPSAIEWYGNLRTFAHRVEQEWMVKRMDDLISREQAIDAIVELSDTIFKNIEKGATYPPRAWFAGMANAESIIKDLPSIDAVPVVRCKDCVCWDTSWKPTRAIEGAYWCSNNDIYMESDDYCSLAERKES